MRSLLLTGTGMIVLTAGLAACSATGHPDGHSNGGGGSGASSAGSAGSGSSGNAGSMGGNSGASGSLSGGNGGSSPDIPIPNELSCPSVPQEILILDFRSGWWSGGGGGQFGPTPLQAIAQTCADISVEYHHFEVSQRFKCLYSTAGGPGCQDIFESLPATSEAILALFEKPSWDDYTQVWVLSGSELDSTDVTVTDALFHHFLDQTKGSCTPVLIGAGDGFITHGNSVANELGLGQVFTTEFAMPGFFSVGFDPAVKVDSLMLPGTELADHVLFQDVDSLADAVSNGFQSTHGDSLADLPATYQVIAHDATGRPAIGIGLIPVEGSADRPFILDSGFQRYYGMTLVKGTQTLLQNFVKYLGSVGCKADPPK